MREGEREREEGREGERECTIAGTTRGVFTSWIRAVLPAGPIVTL